MDYGLFLPLLDNQPSLLTYWSPCCSVGHRDVGLVHLCVVVFWTSLVRKACIIFRGRVWVITPLRRLHHPTSGVLFQRCFILTHRAPGILHGSLRPGTWMADKASFKKRSWCIWSYFPVDHVDAVSRWPITTFTSRTAVDSPAYISYYSQTTSYRYVAVLHVYDKPIFPHATWKDHRLRLVLFVSWYGKLTQFCIVLGIVGFAISQLISPSPKYGQRELRRGWNLRVSRASTPSRSSAGRHIIPPALFLLVL